ncbi:MAG TPA: MBL fold metallo-hydrolase [Anaerolineales bacterium]
MNLSFRWLGVAGLELRANDQVLAIDPFFTRPSLKGLVRPVRMNANLVAEKMPSCDYVLVTHSHWDHLFDVPGLMRQTNAKACGSANTCQLLRLHGVEESRILEVKVGERISLGVFNVDVIAGQHSRIPFGWIFNGGLNPNLRPPLRLQDYRMDECLGYCITVMGMRVLVCAAHPQPAETLFVVAQESHQYYMHLFREVQPHTVVLTHWDNFLRPLSKPLHRFTRPGRMPLWRLTRLAQNILPKATVIIPEIFKHYPLREAGENNQA